MFSLIRSGPKMLLIKSTEVSELKQALINDFSALEYDFSESFENASEDYTILFITKEMKPVLDNESIKETLVVREESDRLLCRLFKADSSRYITDIRTAPRIILLRCVGDITKVMTQLHTDFGGTMGTFTDMFEIGNASSNLVCLTEKPLNRNMSTKDLYGQILKLDGKHGEIYKRLRMQALKYLNIGIGNRDWNEIEIRIFDRYSAYELHYERLIEIFEDLELGIVLGESWSKDYPRLFMSVEVYRVRFFTFHNPVYIKRLLLGMEYMPDGTRMVDYDVYFNQKKIAWTETLQKEDPRVRNQCGLNARAEIMARLTQKDIADIETLESAIIKTRK